MSMKGGEKLAGRLRALAGKASASVRVGFLEGATYPDGTSVAYIAAINEYGKPEEEQPPRPFFRNVIEENKKQWPRTLGRVLSKTEYDGEAALKLMGEKIKGQVQKSIATLEEPQLKESTKKRKKFSKPLIDTGHMQNSVDYEVST